MRRTHLGSHTDDTVVLVQFHRNDKNGFSAGMGWQIFFAVCFYILISRTAEYNCSQCLSIFYRYFITGDIYPSATAGPAEFVRFIYAVFQFCLAVYGFCGTAGIGFILGFGIRFCVHFCGSISGCVVTSICTAISTGCTVIRTSTVSITTGRYITDFFQIFGTECNCSVIPFLMAFRMGSYGNWFVQCSYRNLIRSSCFCFSIQCISSRSFIFDPLVCMICCICSGSHIQIIVTDTT